MAVQTLKKKKLKSLCKLGSYPVTISESVFMLLTSVFWSKTNQTSTPALWDDLVREMLVTRKNETPANPASADLMES